MTVYYVLNQLGPHSKGDVLSFSPEQIGAGVDISHLTSIGAIRVASGDEIARAVPAQIQATHAPQGVGVFTNNGVPDSTTYAGIAAYGSLCWNVAVSPPAIYVNTGTIATPAWTIGGGSGGGLSLPGVTSDGLTPGGITVAGAVAVTGAVSASDIALSGLTGSTHATRWVGTTPSGAPSTGAHLVGDVAASLDGQTYICTVAGTPGTWIDASLPGVTSGPLPAALAGVTPDPAYNPAYTFVSGDLATDASYFGASLVHYVTWTPTASGTVFLLPPEDDGASQKVIFEVWQGVGIGTDVPSRDGSGTSGDSIAFAKFRYAGANRTGIRHDSAASFSVVGGTTYTLTAYQLPDSDTTIPTGRILSLRPWVRSTQPCGGQSPLVSWEPTASAFLAIGESSASALGLDAHAEAGGTASGVGSHAEGGGNASGFLAHAESGGSATGPRSHAEGDGSEASGDTSHAESSGIASGPGSHAESAATASGADSHAEGLATTASGDRSHAENQSSTASGADSHAEGVLTVASGDRSHAQGTESTASVFASDAKGDQALASIRAETAHGSGSHANQGDSQYRRIIAYHETTDATPIQINPGSGQPMPLGINAAWQLLIQLTASRHDTPGTTACWSLAVAITTCGTPRIVGTPTVLSHHNDAAAVSWDVALSVDTTTDALNPALGITVTGEAAQSIYWTGTIHCCHVGV